MIENLQREDLKPRELAMFIQAQVEARAKFGVIAKALAVNNSTITFHLALIDPTECIDTIYSSGRCTSALTIYELRKLHKAYPKQVERWCARDNEVTRVTVATLAMKLKTDAQTSPVASRTTVTRAGETRHAAEQGLDPADGLGGKSVWGTGGQGSASADVLPQTATETAVLFVRFQGRTATVDLQHAPNDPEDVIIYDSDGVRQEVPAVDCIIERLAFPVLTSSQ